MSSLSSQRLNLWYSPSFKNAKFWGSAQRTIDSDGWLNVTPRESDSYKDSYTGINFHLEPHKEYVWSIEIDTPTSSMAKPSNVYTKEWNWLASIETANGRGQCHFTTSDTGEIIICLYGCASGKTRKFRSPMLELASTYDAAVRGGARRTPSCSLGTLARSNRRSAWVVVA